MSSIKVREDVKEAQIQATIIRADGTVEELGTIAYYHRNPLKRLQHKISEILKHGNRPN